ncbi:Tox-REase-5 domain-containing protein [Hyalangium sp.]|uniref:Tox-REase-5 domain-containing protein n=1 Tax=Hyalangium sp. TaxID=2028555 RepID=UPI002D6B95C3|nr:Tox-REase-5 domain-containing protein [Hyalangium sp.]HYI00313.1 Tox-REase-5 domain-containing protein [Hyalangium sp.]
MSDRPTVALQPVLVLAALVLLTSCTASTHGGELFADSASRHRPAPPSSSSDSRTRRHSSQATRDPLGPIDSSLIDTDYFQGLLARGGVPPHVLPKDGRQLTPEDAAHLLSWLLAAEVPLRDFGPWRMAALLLWEVVQEGTPVSRKELHARMRRFHPLLVLRPDGFLVRATTGRAVQQIGEVEFVNGALRAEGFEVGPFYRPRGQVLYAVDHSLDIHLDARVAGVYAPEEDTLGPMAEGAGLAVVDSITGLVNLVMHPVESLEGLAKVPQAVRALIENSPQYWEHFRAMSHGGQVRSVSRLLTQVLITCGTAGAGGSRALSAGSTLGRLGVPVLSLSGEGVLVLRMVAVPAGQLVTAVGTGASAVYILHTATLMANVTGAGGGWGGKGRPPPVGGPGKWVQKAEGMSEDALRYQLQVTGTPPGWVYRVFFGPGPSDYVDFDGFVNGVLLEAKGANLAKFIDGKLKPLPFFTGGDKMLIQATRQWSASRGLPVRWLIAEKKFADYLRTLFRRSNLESIEVIHAPVQP